MSCLISQTCHPYQILSRVKSLCDKQFGRTSDAETPTNKRKVKIFRAVGTELGGGQSGYITGSARNNLIGPSESNAIECHSHFVDGRRGERNCAIKDLPQHRPSLSSGGENFSALSRCYLRSGPDAFRFFFQTLDCLGSSQQAPRGEKSFFSSAFFSGKSGASR